MYTCRQLHPFGAHGGADRLHTAFCRVYFVLHHHCSNFEGSLEMVRFRYILKGRYSCSACIKNADNLMDLLRSICYQSDWTPGKTNSSSFSTLVQLFYGHHHLWATRYTYRSSLKCPVILCSKLAFGQLSDVRVTRHLSVAFQLFQSLHDDFTSISTCSHRFRQLLLLVSNRFYILICWHRH